MNEIEKFDNIAAIPPRILAFLIDFFICLIISVFFPIIGWFISTAYFLLRDALPFYDGQSFGKKIMKIRVLHAETSASLAHDYGRSILRSLLLFIPFFLLIELIVLLRDKNKRQRLGDRVAKTVVVSVKHLNHSPGL